MSTTTTNLRNAAYLLASTEGLQCAKHRTAEDNRGFPSSSIVLAEAEAIDIDEKTE
jgi:hypothetical protein